MKKINLLTADYAEIIKEAQEQGFRSVSNDPGVVLDEAARFLYCTGRGFYPPTNIPADIKRMLRMEDE